MSLDQEHRREAAFRSVERDSGLTLREARAVEGNDYCTAGEHDRVCALATEVYWQVIPDAALELRFKTLTQSKAIMKTAKNITRLPLTAGGVAMLIGPILALPVCVGMSAESALPQDDKMGIEVLSISVSKLSRDSFGNAILPFRSNSMQEGEGGTVVLSRLTTQPAAPLTLLPENCRLLSFKDDLGTDLLGSDNGGLRDPFFSRNRPLEILTAAEPGVLGVRARSARVPARGAKRVDAEVLLVYCPNDAARLEQKVGVSLQTNEAVVVGPIRLKFTTYSSFYPRTNQVAGNSESVCWLASCLREKGAAVASVALFSEKSDEPIMVIKRFDAEADAGRSSSGHYNGRPASGKSQDTAAGSVAQGFRPPEDRKVTIKVRYYDPASLIEKHCVISTGLSP